MSTWTSRVLIAAGLALALTGCDEIAGTGGQNEPLTRAALSGGAVTLALPQGYCIDRSSLRQRGREGFALVARCDTLGVEGWFRAQDLVILTVSTAPQSEGAAPPSADSLVRAAAPDGLLERRERGGMPIVKLQGSAPETQGVSTVYWRAAFPVNGHLVALSLYAPEGSSVLRGGGPNLLAEVGAATVAASTPGAEAGKARAPGAAGGPDGPDGPHAGTKVTGGNFSAQGRIAGLSN